MSLTGTLLGAAEAAAVDRAAWTARIAAAIDGRVEAQARALGYNSAAACAGYAASTVSTWAAEAQAFIGWRDAIWVAAFALQSAQDMTGDRPEWEDLLAQLPPWPG